MKALLAISIKVRLYAILFAGFALTIAMVTSRTYELQAALVGTITIVYAVAMSVYLRLRGPNAFINGALAGGAHPSLGLFGNLPHNWPRFAKHAVLYAVGALVGLVLLASEQGSAFVESADEVAYLRSVGAGKVIVAAIFATVEFLAVPLIMRLGPNPSVGPAVAWFTVAGLVALLVGHLVLVLIWPQLTSQPELSLFLDLVHYLPVSAVLLFGMCIFVRGVSVSAWRTHLTEQTLRAEAAERGRQLAESQLAMMQAQIEPHFLYNTLASVQYLVRKDGASADFLLTQLIRYLRHAMPKLRQPMSTLAQEFELADAFLQIARMRMGGRLSVNVELALDLHDIAFPPLVLQTMVENALKHGVEPKVGPVWVNVSAELAGDQLQLVVSDNGVGIGYGPSGNAGSGTGLKNIRERLAGIYEGRASLSVNSLPEGGVAATVHLDLRQPIKSTTLTQIQES